MSKPLCMHCEKNTLAQITFEDIEMLFHCSNCGTLYEVIEEDGGLEIENCVCVPELTRNLL